MSHAWALARRRRAARPSSRSRSWRPHLVPPAIAFTAAGLLIGPEVLGWVDVAPNAESLRLLAEATLALVLFADASRIDLRALRDELRAAGAPARDRTAADDRRRHPGPP